MWVFKIFVSISNTPRAPRKRVVRKIIICGKSVNSKAEKSLNVEQAVEGN